MNHTKRTTKNQFGCIVLHVGVLDQLVFHRLLNSVFLIALKMESDDSPLPPIPPRHEDAGGYRHTQMETFFYLGPLIIFVFLSVVVVTTGSGALFATTDEALDLRWIGYLLSGKSHGA